jgi:hypothetical protein
VYNTDPRKRLCTVPTDQIALHTNTGKTITASYTHSFPRSGSRRYFLTPFILNTYMHRYLFTVIILLILVFILPSKTVPAQEPWSDRSKFWAATSAIALANDWATTRDMTQRYNEGYHELNPILGRNPSANRVDLHFLIAIPVVYLIADNIESDLARTRWLQLVTIVEGTVGLNNVRIGLRWGF